MTTHSTQKNEEIEYIYFEHNGVKEKVWVKPKP